MIKVAWEDDADPERGFKYLYLTPEDYLKLSSGAATSGDVVRTQLVHEGDENRCESKNYEVRVCADMSKKLKDRLRYFAL